MADETVSSGASSIRAVVRASALLHRREELREVVLDPGEVHLVEDEVVAAAAASAASLRTPRRPRGGSG